MKKKITELTDIQLLVDAFYTKIRKDDLLEPIFNGVIQDGWPGHLNKMYFFWQTVLMGEHTYYGNPFTPHANLPVEKQHFDRWMGLFCQTWDQYFEGEIAEEAKWRATKMAKMFQYKLVQYSKTNSIPLI